MTPTTMSADVATPAFDTAQDAIVDLTVALTHEIFEHADAFVSDGESLNYYAIFQWLHQIEQDQGTVNEATVGTAGSTWLLARRLGDTLQDSVSTIIQYTALQRAVQDMTQVFLFSNLMQFWRMNDSLQDDDPLAQVMKAEKMHGFE